MIKLPIKNLKEEYEDIEYSAKFRIELMLYYFLSDESLHHKKEIQI